MRVLGMISGTSHDGVDSAVVDFAADGDMVRGRIVHTDATPYPASLRARLAAALPPASTSLAEVCELDTLIGQTFADAAIAAIAAAGDVDVIVSHGQTVFHWVDAGHALGTLQIGQPAWIAEATGSPVVSDVRIRDIAAGGQGAPLVSYLDSLLLSALDGVPAALNLGGISNVTILRDGSLSAYDIGPANALIDAAVTAAQAHPRGFDVDGAIAASGSVDDKLLAVLLDDAYYRLPAPKSTGKEHFHGRYIDEAVATAGAAPGTADLVATLTELTVRTVVDDARAAGITTLVMSGGGSRNPVILNGLRDGLPGTTVVTSDEFGAPIDDKEAIAFALLGWCTMHGLPGNHPAGTGATGGRVLGTITPGAKPLRLPEPLTHPPRSLRLEPGAPA